METEKIYSINIFYISCIGFDFNNSYKAYKYAV